MELEKAWGLGDAGEIAGSYYAKSAWCTTVSMQAEWASGRTKIMNCLRPHLTVLLTVMYKVKLLWQCFGTTESFY